MIKSIGYFQEAIVTTTSSRVPIGLMTDLSAISKMMGAGLSPGNYNYVIVSYVMEFISVPKSTSVLGRSTMFISMVTMGFPGS